MNGMALCAGHAGLELGLGLALGRGYQTVCYVEREAYAAASLVARMDDAALDRAPVWDDITTFDGRPWRGSVDIVTGGYPCQPFSAAGQRLGAKDPRHLWPWIRDIVADVQPSFCYFENVRGHVTNGLDRVRADLRELGYQTETPDGEPCYGLFSAAEVGAPHRRERLFLLAYRKGEREREPADQGGSVNARRAAREDACGGGGQLANPALQGGRRVSIRWREPRKTTGDIDGAGPRLDDAECAGNERDGEAVPWEAEPGRPFPPGPEDANAWADVLQEHPHLAPALSGEEAESVFYGVDDGLAYRLDRLRSTGNGVVPLVAAKAICCLAARALGGVQAAKKRLK